ncbi:MAG: ABC transporter permease [Bacteroidales bacterium]|nr:ABC transporter permease [Bacteroidales bacterium]
MKRFFSFVYKEFCHILRDVKTLIVLLFMPVILIMLFGMALSTEIKNVKVAIYDPSMDIATQRIVRQLDASTYFTITRMIVNQAEINDIFLDGTAEIVMVFQENFYNRVLHDGDASIQVIADGSNTNVATMGVFYLSSIISSFQQEMAREMVMNAADPEQAAAMAGDVINITSRMLYNPQMQSSFNFVPGVMGMILMLICAMMTSISIVREKQRGTMEVLLVSPVNPMSVILAKTIPYFVLSSLNLVTILVLSVHLLGVPIAGSLLELFVVSLIFILVSLSLGIFISNVVDTQEVAILISSLVLMLPTMMLSGMLFPIESMPLPLQWASWFVPAKWYVEAVKLIMIQGVSAAMCWKHFTILCAFLVAHVTLSISFFKDRL